MAEVIDTVEDIHTGGPLNGKPGIMMIVFKSPDANVISTVDNVKALLPTLRASILARDQPARGAGSNDDDPRVGEGCDADTGDLDRAGDPGGVSFPAGAAIDDDPERFGAAEPAGDVWRLCICWGTRWTICR